MAKIITNKRGFRVLLLSNAETKALGFGFEDGCYCDFCSRQVNKDENYYIAVLDSIHCKNCCKRFCIGHIRHPEDSEYEDRKYSNVIKTLKHMGFKVEETEKL